MDGKSIAEKRNNKLAEEISSIGSPGLAVIMAGDNDASKLYVDIKQKKCKQAGITPYLYNFKEDVTEQELLEKVQELNNDDNIHGILVQLPMPGHINQRKVLDLVAVEKDVDGLNSRNLAGVFLGTKSYIPCTPRGVLNLLQEYNIDLEGKNVCIVGYSDIVGKPLSALCLNRNATVTVCHVKTKDLKQHTSKADILMSSTGVAGLIKEDMVKDNAVVIDIGITKVDGKTTGDVDYERVKEKCSHITPVPGGVGPMTVSSLMENTLLAYKGEIYGKN